MLTFRTSQKHPAISRCELIAIISAGFLFQACKPLVSLHPFFSEEEWIGAYTPDSSNDDAGVFVFRHRSNYETWGSGIQIERERVPRSYTHAKLTPGEYRVLWYFSEDHLTGRKFVSLTLVLNVQAGRRYQLDSDPATGASLSRPMLGLLIRKPEKL